MEGVIGYIYQIVSDQTEKVYIGSTKMRLNLRFNLHTANCRRYIAGRTKGYCSSFEILAFPDARIDLLEVVYDWEDLKQIEQAYIDERPNAVNRQRAAPRDEYHYCSACNCEIKLGKSNSGAYSTSNVSYHEKSKKHQQNLAKK